MSILSQYLVDNRSRFCRYWVATGLIVIRFVDSFSCAYFRFDSGNGEKNGNDNGDEN